MIKTDKRGLIYNNMIYNSIYALFEKGIDLKSYFSSNLALHIIEPKSFKEYHSDPKDIRVISKKDNIF